jgi:glycosyltransferase A (GT-A) superfamily protein (DUF2064 family)
LTSESAIILFTKAPIPGVVKTRLIEPNGNSPNAEDAATLYKSILMDTLNAAKNACDATGAKLIISFTPREGEGCLKSLVEQVTEDAIFHLQAGSTVTSKVRDSFEFAFSLGFTSGFLIPGDHPDLDGSTLSDAIQRICKSPNPSVVLGPTFDGGGYLLGFNRSSFERIDFSLEDTYRVCADIFLKARCAGISCSFLGNKNDIDDWEDASRFLAYCKKARPQKECSTRVSLERLGFERTQFSNHGKKLSIIVPTLNEEKRIGSLLDSLKTQTVKDYEIILVDGSSNDDTVSKAWARVDKIAYVAKPSRKSQELVGGFGARGEILVFLHGDSIVSPTLCESIIRATDVDANIVGGSCRAIFDGSDSKIKFLNVMRICGDKLFSIHGISSGFFVKRRAFILANGFREDVMEEAVDFQNRTKDWGKFVTLNEYIRSSPRRFESKKTFFPTFVIWVATVFLTYLRLNPPGVEQKLWKAVR